MQNHLARCSAFTLTLLPLLVACGGNSSESKKNSVSAAGDAYVAGDSQPAPGDSQPAPGDSQPAPGDSQPAPGDSHTVDTMAPTISITFPSAGATIAGTITVLIDAADDRGIDHVELTIDGSGGSSDFTAPYEFSVNTRLLSTELHTLVATVYDIGGNMADDSISVTVVRDGSTALPPDPSSVAPDLDPTVAATLDVTNSFLYSGLDPIQTGVVEGTMDPLRFAVLRGRVTERNGDPISGVRITVLEHPEFGRTATREDGLFDMAVNGGGGLTVDYDKEGYLPVQRAVDVPWQDYSWAPTIVMIALDPQVTTIDLTSNAPMQVAMGSEMSDADGVRTAVVMIPQGTDAVLTMPDGSTTPITTLSIRATEYTVGASGLAAMPGTLPAASGYTYAVELSVDEAIAVGATHVQFNQPVYTYVDNFLDFPVGGVVPAGYYDRGQGKWIPSNNGVILKVLGVTGDMADIDVTGDDLADSGTVLTDLAISDDERVQLALLYGAGSSLWRVPVRHFTPWDCNWPYGLPPNTLKPPYHRRNPRNPEDNDCENGSIIYCQSQILGEKIPLTGTFMGLHYRSNRAPGYVDNYTVNIPITDDEGIIPDTLNGITLSTWIAGRALESVSFPLVIGQDYLFTWDGKDAYGRKAIGRQRLTYIIQYTYDPHYYKPAAFQKSFGRYANPQQSTEFVAIGKTRTDAQVGLIIHSPRIYLGSSGALPPVAGYSLDAHHNYEFTTSLLSLGSGSQRSGSGNEIPRAVKTVDWEWGTNTCKKSVRDLHISADGTIYFACSTRISNFGTGYIIHRRSSSGADQIVFGAGSEVLSSGALASDVYNRNTMDAFTVADDGTIYFSINAPLPSGGFGSKSHIWKIDTDGVLDFMAGSETWQPFVDGADAVDMYLVDEVHGMALNSSGELHFSTGDTIRKLVDGAMMLVSQDYRSSVEIAGMVFDKQDRLFYSDGRRSIRRIDTDGTAEMVAGTSTNGFSGDGGPSDVAQLNYPSALAIGNDGTLYIAEFHRVRGIRLDGVIFTMAGEGSSTYPRDPPIEEYALDAEAPKVLALGVHPDGSIYYTDRNTAAESRTRRVIRPLPRYTATALAVASSDGLEIYHFDAQGRHLMTTSSLNNAILYRFAYDANNQLLNIIDAQDRAITVERDADGAPTAIVAPDGQRTELTVNENGYLESVTNPAGETITLTYQTAPVDAPEQIGLLKTFTDGNGNTSTMTYDALGYLTRDEDAAGGFKSLSHEQTSHGTLVTLTTAEGRTTLYETQSRLAGISFSSVTDPSGAITLTQSNADGSTVTTYPNGTMVTSRYAPDPRFGLQSPVLEEMVVTLPSGLTKTITKSRSASLSDPFDVTSLTNLVDTTTINGLAALETFELATNTHTRSSPLGREITSLLDANLRVVELNFDASLDAISTTYDDQGRASSISQGLQSEHYSYDAAGRLTIRGDAAGSQTVMTYDDADRIVDLARADGQALGYAYDTHGNLILYVMPSGDEHSVSFTERHQRRSYTPPGGTPSTEHYNLDGQRVMRVLASGREIKNTFDAGGRGIGVDYPSATVAYSFVGNTDRVETMSRTPLLGGGSQQTNYTYDGGFLASSTVAGIANASFVYSLDNRFLTTGISLVSGGDAIDMTFAYDDDGEIVGYGQFTFTRDGPGGDVSRISDNTLSLNLSHDSLGRISSRAFFAGGSSLYSVDLERNNRGLIERKIEVVDGVTHLYDYSYDVVGRLLESIQDESRSILYTYDANGNRLAASADSAEYDSQDRIIHHGAVDYDFDIDGFMTQRGLTSFVYSARGELLSALPTSGGQIDYYYDALSRRVGRVDGSGTYEYFYGRPDNMLLVSAYRSPNGQLTQLYYDDADLLIAFERQGVMFYVATDEMGTPKLIIDASRNIVAQREYDAFGALVSDSNPALDLPIGFAGGLEDAQTTLVHFGFRDYDPLAGRWAARDPLLFAGGQANLYVYVGNSPTNIRDPSGLITVAGGFYEGLGLGFEFTYKDGGFALCGEGGIGVGAGFSISDGDLPQGGTSIVREISAGCGPVGGSIKAETPLDGCGGGSRTLQQQLDDLEAEAHLGALKLSSKSGLGVGGIGSDNLHASCGYGAKMAAKHCTRF